MIVRNGFLTKCLALILMTMAGAVPLWANNANSDGAVLRLAGSGQWSAASLVNAEAGIDLRGKPLAALDSVPSPDIVVRLEPVYIDTLPPVLSSLASVLDLFGPAAPTTITFASNEALRNYPNVTVGGNVAVYAGRSGLNYYYLFTPSPSDFAGDLIVQASGRDMEGNPGATSTTLAMTIDATAPASQVLLPTGGTNRLKVPVVWTSSDATAGVQTVEIFWSKDGNTYASLGAFDPAITSTTIDTSTMGWDGNYTFYSVARDHVGNTETAPSAEDVAVLVNAVPSPASVPAPENATVRVERPSVMDWADADAADTYSVYLWSTYLPRPSEPTFTGLTASELDVTGWVNWGYSYIWQVVAEAPDVSTPGPIWRFNVHYAEKPALPIPTHLAKNVPSFLNSLEWKDCSGALAYDVFLWPTYHPRPSQPTYTNLTGSEVANLGTSLRMGHTYIWQVAAKGRYGERLGDPWRFTLSSIPTPPARVEHWALY